MKTTKLHTSCFMESSYANLTLDSDHQRQKRAQYVIKSELKHCEGQRKADKMCQLSIHKDKGIVRANGRCNEHCYDAKIILVYIYKMAGYPFLAYCTKIYQDLKC